MQVQQNVSLRNFTTFGIDVLAKHFAAFASLVQLQELLYYQNKTSLVFRNLQNLLILGGGSNILLTKNFDGLVLKNEIQGIEVTKEEDEFYYVKAGAGENWHKLVMFCVENNYAGMENLSLIPGSVGASPIQNIGAYGVEVKDVFDTLEAYDKQDKTVVTFTVNDCKFGYRESVFKHIFKDRFIILNVIFKLHKIPVFNTSYGAIQDELQNMQADVSVKNIAQAVINIRSSKLPDPAVIGNAGSFFKNPVVSNDIFVELKKNYLGIIGFPADENTTKLAAGWLIEQCGWKGYRNGDAGCYSKQALVLVNYGNATGEEIFKLSEAIIKSVKHKFGVTLQREVNIL